MIERREGRTLVPPIGERDHIRGSRRALVSLLEYGDFECPFCGRAHVVLREIERLLGDELSFCFRHFPLSMAHPNAELAAEATECAGAQGAFWPMHDRLFENQDALEPPDLAGHAAALGLDLDRFTRELRERRYQERVREDFLSGVRSGVNGTPTFFIDGRRYDGSWESGPLLETLEERIAQGRRRAG
ncbi:MAG TPA: thioredoxin domain-containing protein [Planctomycetota bacterium]|nr:thioredoxin domain-containing protein [Planctomycetota bacterium]